MTNHLHYQGRPLPSKATGAQSETSGQSSDTELPFTNTSSISHRVGLTYRPTRWENACSSSRASIYYKRTLNLLLRRGKFFKGPYIPIFTHNPIYYQTPDNLLPAIFHKHLPMDANQGYWPSSHRSHRFWTPPHIN